MEHLEHFGLSRDPFSNETQVDLFFASEVHTDCQRRLLRGVQQAKGLCLVTGAPGCGKTMTLRHFFEELDEDRFEACLLVPVPGVSDGDWVLCRFAAQLGIEEVARERSEMLAQIYEALSLVRDKTFLQGLRDLMRAVESGENVLRWSGRFASSWVPNIV